MSPQNELDIVDTSLIRLSIQEVMKSLDIPPALNVIPETFEQLKMMLNIFQPHVLQDSAQGILSPTSRKLFPVDNARIVNGKVQFRYAPLYNKENSKFPIELYPCDLVLISHRFGVADDIKDVLTGQFRFAIVTSIPKKEALRLKNNRDRGYYAQLVFIESGNSSELDVHDVVDILNGSNCLDVLTTMVPFIRVFKSLLDIDIHKTSPLLDIILQNGRGSNTWNPLDCKTIKFLKEDPHYVALNPAQKEVTNHVIFAMNSRADLTLVQGPPGTGKTFSTCVMIYNAIRYLKGDGPIVVCAPSNVAVARSANKFVEMYCATDRFNLQQIAILGREDKMDNGKTLSKLAFQRFYGTDPSSIKNKEWHKIKSKMAIIFCTVSCVMSSRMKNLHYSHVYCDEAGQVDEANALMLVQNTVKQLVMIGDPCQLPPFTLIKDAKNLHSNRSLFERFWDLKHSCCKMLNVQYRMDPIISKMVSDFMYNGKLQNGENVFKYNFDFDYPFKTLEFINVNGAEVRCNPSFENKSEALKIAKIIDQILDKHRLKNRDTDIMAPSIGVITGYAAQRDRIRLLLSQHKDEDIQIDTFDSFQGQEKDIIILSLVRTAGIGFNKELNRTNVAISRAKKSLLIVGKYSNFARTKPWKGIIKYIEGLDINKSTPSKPAKPKKQLKNSKDDIQPKIVKKNTSCAPDAKSKLLPWIDAHLVKNNSKVPLDQIYGKKLKILQIKKDEHGLKVHVNLILMLIQHLVPVRLWDTGFKVSIAGYISLLRNSKIIEIVPLIDTWVRVLKRGIPEESSSFHFKEVPVKKAKLTKKKSISKVLPVLDCALPGDKKAACIEKKRAEQKIRIEQIARKLASERHVRDSIKYEQINQNIQRQRERERYLYMQKDQYCREQRERNEQNKHFNECVIL